MTDHTEPNRCSRCGGSTATDKSGRMTQWVVSCICQKTVITPESARQEVTEQTLLLCQTCGKRVVEGREGSFTQWVFRSDGCNCTTPKPVETVVNLTKEVQALKPGKAKPDPGSTTDSAAESNPDTEPTSLPGLEIEPDKFPNQRYKPLSLIGQGASGSVYVCWDRLLKKRVAIKALHRLEAAELMSFQQEARTMSKLNHDSIVKILDFGATAGGVPYMVLELVNGFSMEKCVSINGPFPVPIALSLIRQVCSALSHAHGIGVFHRDVKTSNILVSHLESAEPQAKVIDFGVASYKFARQDSTEVQGRTIVGSPMYMAPDQAQGLKYTERSEIYSIGCCMFEALTGQVPFSGATAMETISLHAHCPPPTLAERARSNPPLYNLGQSNSSVHSSDQSFSEELEAVVAKCLHKNPDERYASADDLIAAIHTLQEKESLLAAKKARRIESEESKVHDRNKKNRQRTIALASTIFAGIVATAIGMATMKQLSTPNAAQNKLRTNLATESNAVSESPANLFTVRQKQPEEKILQKGTAQPNQLPSNIQSRKDSLTERERAKRFNRLVAEPEKLDEKHSFVTTFRDKSDRWGQVVVVGHGNVRDEDLAELAGKKINNLSLCNMQNLNGWGLKYVASPHLKRISLSDSSVGDEGFKELSKCKALMELNCYRTKVTDKGFEYISALPLVSVIAGHNAITDKSLDSILKLTDLESVDVSTTRITLKSIPRFSKLTESGKLRQLYVSRLLNEGTELPDISSLRSLVGLGICNLRLTDKSLKQVATLKKLQFLGFSDNDATDYGLLYLLSLKDLTDMDVSNNLKITEEGIARLQRLKPNLKINY